MKRLVVFTALITSLIASQASTIQSGNENFRKSTVTVVRPQTVTRNVQVRVKIQKPKLFVGNPHKVTLFVDDWDDDFLEIDDLITSYRRRDLTKIEHPDGISEKVRWRLFLARQLAMLKYKEIHS